MRLESVWREEECPPFATAGWSRQLRLLRAASPSVGICRRFRYESRLAEPALAVPGVPSWRCDLRCDNAASSPGPTRTACSCGLRCCRLGQVSLGLVAP